MRSAARRALALAGRAAPAQLAAYLALAVVAGVVPLAFAWLTKLLVDGLAGGDMGWPEAAALVGALAAAGVAAALTPHAGRYLRAEMGRRIGEAAVERLYAAMDRLVGLARFEDPVFLNRVQLARSSGAGGPGMVVEGGLGMVQAVVTLVGFAGTLFLLGPWVAVVVVVAAVPALLAELSLSRRRARMTVEVGHAERRELFYAGLLTDTAAAKEVRLFGTGPYLWRRMAAEIRTVNLAHRRVDRRELAVQGGLALFGALLSGGLLVWSVRAALTGALTVGDVALVLAAVGSVQGALAGLVGEAVSMHQALLLFGHYLEVVDAEPDLPVRRPARPAVALRHGIELRDVWFRYAEDQPWVLRGVDLVLPAGRSTALVGVNGAGKSTLVKLLCRLYDPTRGAVLWDGVDLRDLDPGELRRRIRAVFQDATHYDLTARENIALGDLTALDDPGRVERAARRAGVHELLSGLPRGYETPLTRIYLTEQAGADPAGGVQLSGGQWQRVALARALVHERPDLLILDEPSSALDAEAEHEVHARLREHRRDRTSLLVSHRLGVVREADHIVVLAGGRLVERGDHDELLALGGAYARLFALQARGYRSAAQELSR
ncbi:multidrug ABC transporter permease [Amorphoplanes nipponensis]|uniref:Multidrug ABC transporter permease n=1 Tax=Actinoplanes nipponensis TaxID=135950 RepID=A0A919JAC2_9ACTN|nr:ABC transporter ATP-binding protein [Actinoplanes nipponensis]GIE47309.1 multidrug ABC transporter permease [Actinoplanes nipponensis]